MSRTVAIIQARMSSTRLPGKVLEPLLGMPAIVFMVERVRKARSVAHVVVATSSEPSDDPLAAVLAERGIDTYRGSLSDVLDRFYRAAVAARGDPLVRLTGDCPLVDWDLVDSAVELVLRQGYDYASLADPPTFPVGLDVEAFRFGVLEQAWREAKLPSEREHVTPFIRTRPERFKLANLVALADFSSLRWTVDHEDDLAYVRSLLAEVRATSPTSFDRFDLYRAIERSASLRAAPRHQRNEGYLKSLRNDPSSAGP